MIDPSFWEDPDIGSLSVQERLLFIGLFSNADDEGRGEADPRYLRKAIFGFDNDVSFDNVGEMLENIVKGVRGVTVYEKDDRKYYALLHWKRYQKVSHPTVSSIPAPDGVYANGEGNNVGEIFRYWEKANGSITGAVAQEIGAMIDEWDEYVAGLDEVNSDKKISGVDATLEALKIGVRAKTRPHINYIWGILKNWMTNGYKANAPKSGETKLEVSEGLSIEDIAKAKAKKKGGKK